MIVTVEMAQSLMILDLGVKESFIRTVSKDLPNCKMESIENLFSRDYDLTSFSAAALFYTPGLPCTLSICDSHACTLVLELCMVMKIIQPRASMSNERHVLGLPRTCLSRINPLLAVISLLFWPSSVVGLFPC